ncbi:response regulator transcription factor [Virgibacillus salexigens]|nr:response regulator transcription factor [Virgibacillus kapii]
MINVMLVDDQQLFIDGVKALLNNEEDLQVVATATNGKNGILRFIEHLPDLVLVDIHMPHTDVIKLIVEIKENHPNTKIIVLTTFTDEDAIISAIYVGADGFLLKKLKGDQFISCIRDVIENEIVFSGEVSRILSKHIMERQFNKREILENSLQNSSLELSNREIDIAVLMVEGFSNKHIAQRLFLSEGTIKNYISGIYQTFGIHNRKQLISCFRQLLDKN